LSCISNSSEDDVLESEYVYEEIPERKAILEDKESQKLKSLVYSKIDQTDSYSITYINQLY